MINNGNRERVVKMLRQGLPHAVICAKLNLSRGTVSGYANWAKAQDPSYSDRRKGRPKSVIARLPPPVLNWLADQRPDGAGVEDIIVAIIQDAYHEEMGK
jgi:hypothetical protein